MNLPQMSSDAPSKMRYSRCYAMRYHSSAVNAAMVAGYGSHAVHGFDVSFSVNRALRPAPASRVECCRNEVTAG